MDENNYRILVVDDSPMILGLTKAILEKVGYHVETLESGNTALQRLEQMSTMGEKLPDLVISDIEMPGINGIKLVRRCRELYPNLPFILSSGNIRDYKDKLEALNIPYLEKTASTHLIKDLTDKVKEELNKNRS